MKAHVTAIFLLQLAGLAVAQGTTPSAELQPEELDSNNTMSIAARNEQEKNWHGSGAVVCGIYANAKPKKIRDFAYDLDNKDYNKKWTIGAGQCNRVKCWDTSALYVCNVGFCYSIPVDSRQFDKRKYHRVSLKNKILIFL